MNGATCYDLPDNFVCKCASGYHGDLCDQTSEVPSSVTCAHDTVDVTTAPSNIESTCPICPNETRESAINDTQQCPDTIPCPVCPECITAAPCLEITTAAPEITTSCPTPEPEMDHCAGTPCQNNGTCYNGTSGFICKCSGLWGGVACIEGNTILFHNLDNN